MNGLIFSMEASSIKKKNDVFKAKLLWPFQVVSQACETQSNVQILNLPFVSLFIIIICLNYYSFGISKQRYWSCIVDLND